MTPEAVFRFAPATMLVLASLWLLLATKRTSRTIGGNAYGFGGTARERGTQILFRGAVVGGLGATGSYAAGLSWSVLRPFAQDAWHQAAGLFVVGLGLLLVVVAQADMGRRWRIGVPSIAPDELVTDGLFARSRNPVFVGMLAMALGLSLAVPSPSMIVASVCFWLACELQVRDEERFLANAFGSRYLNYKRKVRRWI